MNTRPERPALPPPLDPFNQRSDQEKGGLPAAPASLQAFIEVLFHSPTALQARVLADGDR